MSDQKLTFNAPVTIRYSGDWCSPKCEWRDTREYGFGDDYKFCYWFRELLSSESSGRTLRCSECINFAHKIKCATGDRQSLLSEKTALERMLASLPESSVIDRMSLEARKLEVEKQLADKQM